MIGLAIVTEADDTVLSRPFPIPRTMGVDSLYRASFSNLPMLNSRFNKLHKQGSQRAILTMVPSKFAASYFEDILEYWDDTLVYDITFKAVLGE